MNILIIRPVTPKLHERHWQFDVRLNGNKPELYLYAYHELQRPTPRHKFQQVQQWCRYFRWSATVPEAAARPPQDVVEEALLAVRKAVAYVGETA